MTEFCEFIKNTNLMSSFPLEKPICASCNYIIEEDIKLKIEPNILLHSECLICYQCKKSLADEESCFIKFGRIFCYSHYRALFFKSCSICQNGFTTTDFVLPLCQDNYCHAKCLLCTICKKILTSGCKYTISNWSIICSDCQLLSKLSNFIEFSNNNNIQTCKSYSSENSYENLEVDMKNKSSSSIDKEKSIDDSDDEELSSDIECFDSDSDDISQSIQSNSQNCNDQFNKSKKKPRNRTVLSEKQLSTLQSYYQMNPKPDALTKEQLMEVTGLKQRVISVWFQNKRCKEKKRRISEELNKNKSPGILATAELMLTQSPIEYDPQLTGIKIEKVYNNSKQLTKDASYIKNYFTSMLSDQKPDQSINNRCNAPLVQSVNTLNQYSNTSRLH